VPCSVARERVSHVARHDVAVAWLAKSVGYAIVPVLVLPLLLTLTTGDFSAVPDYAWRALLLGAVIALSGAGAGGPRTQRVANLGDPGTDALIVHSSTYRQNGCPAGSSITFTLCCG